MADRVPYLYALLRLVPRIERGECFNVGIAMLSRSRRFLAVRTHLDEVKLAALAPDVDAGLVRAHLVALERIAAGDRESSPMAALEPAERFHWIASTSNMMIQPSPVHTGLTSNPDATLSRLMRELVE